MTPGCLKKHTKVSALLTLAVGIVAQATQTSDKSSVNTDKAAGNNNNQTAGFEIYKHGVTLSCISYGKPKKQRKMSSELAKGIQLF